MGKIQRRNDKDLSFRISAMAKADIFETEQHPQREAKSKEAFQI